MDTTGYCGRFLFSRPVDAGAVLALLEHNRAAFA